MELWILVAAAAASSLFVFLDRRRAYAAADDGEEGRAEELRAWAEPLGLRVRAAPAEGELSPWARLGLLARGIDGLDLRPGLGTVQDVRSLNAVSGVYDGVRVLVFERRWRFVARSRGKWERERVSHRYAHAFAALLDREAPSLRVTSTQAAACPRGEPDPREEARFLTPEAIDLLAARPGWTLECSGRALLLYTEGRFPPKEMTSFLNFGLEFLHALSNPPRE
ncbi:MAG: hypothetical protein HY553_08720 [Elusimicrobia bacterium]|nr:hypothetical protein [Elusimicrobiota bacterium]